MDKKKTNFSFYSVALAMIALGAAIFAIGLASWLLNMFGSYHFVFPAAKIIGGAIVISLGYIQLELELLRQK